MDEESSTEASSTLRYAAEVERRVREAVSLNEPLLFLVWGAVYLIGYGSLYVNMKWVNDGPPIVGFVLLGAMALSGFIVTFSEIRKRFRGLRGNTHETVNRMMTLWSILLVVWILIEALAFTRYGSQSTSMPEIGAVAGATATLLVGVMYLLVSRDFPLWQICLGMALVFVGTGGLVIDPDYSILFVAVGAGASFFLSAAYSVRRRRPVDSATGRGDHA